MPIAMRTSGGLRDAKWAANAAVAEIGRNGEFEDRRRPRRTGLQVARVLVVLHDLVMPIPGFTANVDHAVNSGFRILLVRHTAWAARGQIRCN